VPHRFAIVGGGLTATSLLCQLVERLRGKTGPQTVAPPALSVAVFEKQDIFGPGVPHSARFVLPFHITNMCAKDMSVFSERPEDFQDWVLANRDALRQGWPELDAAYACPGCRPQQCRHYPRAVMGEYLKARFQEAVVAARRLGMPVELYPCTEVIDLRVQDGRIRLAACERPSGKPLAMEVDGALLATGHWFEETQTENYFSSPWPAEALLGGIPSGESVGVIGTSLSAIEVALTLTSDGRFDRRRAGGLVFVPHRNSRNVVLYSRGGLLPRVRGRPGQRRNQHLSCDSARRLMVAAPGALTLPVIFDLLERELTDAYGGPFDWRKVIDPPEVPADRLRQYIREAVEGDGPDGELIWQTVLHQIFPVAREIYLNLALPERKRFDRHYTTLFFMHAATQPAVNAEKLLALMEAGVLTVVKLGDDYRFVLDDATGEFHFIYRDESGRRRSDAYRFVVNARGQPRSLEKDPSLLTRNILAHGVVRIEETRADDSPAGSFSYKTGTILVDPETHRVLSPGLGGSSGPTPAIFAVGAMTRGQMIDASMAAGIARSTAAVVDQVIDFIGMGGGR